MIRSEARDRMPVRARRSAPARRLAAGLAALIFLAGGVEAGRCDEAREGSPAVVQARSATVLQAPDARAYPLAELPRGEAVVIAARRPDGWVEIEPPAGLLCWIDAGALVPTGQAGWARVARTTTVRAGRPGVRLPGPPCGTMEAGHLVRTQPVPEIELGSGPGSQHWRAIDPPPGYPCYVRAECLERGPSSAISATSPGEPSLLASALGPGLTSLGDPPSEPLRASASGQALAGIEAQHRRVLRLPLAEWRLSAVRSRYQALMEQSSDAELSRLLRQRLVQIDRQEQTAASARRVSRLLTTTGVEPLEPLAAVRAPSNSRPPLGYEATGMLQPSSQLVEGQRVYALIGDEGYSIAYLRFLPGVDAEKHVGRQVGVSGRSRHVAHLRRQIIDVSDLDVLSSAP